MARAERGGSKRKEKGCSSPQGNADLGLKEPHDQDAELVKVVRTTIANVTTYAADDFYVLAWHSTRERETG